MLLISGWPVSKLGLVTGAWWLLGAIPTLAFLGSGLWVARRKWIDRAPQDSRLLTALWITLGVGSRFGLTSVGWMLYGVPWVAMALVPHSFIDDWKWEEQAYRCFDLRPGRALTDEAIQAAGLSPDWLRGPMKPTAPYLDGRHLTGMLSNGLSGPMWCEVTVREGVISGRHLVVGPGF